MLLKIFTCTQLYIIVLGGFDHQCFRLKKLYESSNIKTSDGDKYRLFSAAALVLLLFIQN